jgi:hypothetical protein
MRKRSEFEVELEMATEEARKQGMDIPALYQVRKAHRGNMQQLKEASSFRPGRQGYPFGLYEWVASEYLRLARKKDKKSWDPPEIGRSGERLSRVEVTVSNARDWVHRARELELLSKGIQGKIHAEPGPALRAEFH